MIQVHVCNQTGLDWTGLSWAFVRHTESLKHETDMDGGRLTYRQLRKTGDATKHTSIMPMPARTPARSLGDRSQCFDIGACAIPASSFVLVTLLSQTNIYHNHNHNHNHNHDPRARHQCPCAECALHKPNTCRIESTRD